MKIFFALLLFLWCGAAMAQNWQCMQPGQKVYFTNSKRHYLRGMRIDSVQSSAGGTIYYPYHSPRGAFSSFGHLDTVNGGSWLGKTVIALSDGTTLFANTRGDTVVLKTLAGVGAQWRFYDDTAATYYRATVLSAGTAIVLGTSDSVKRIGITVMQGNSVLAGDSINQYSVILSKSHGIIQAFDFYNFPYQKNGNGTGSGQYAYVDYFVGQNTPTDTGLALFRLVNLQLPVYNNVFDWNVGDVLQYDIYNPFDAIAPAPPFGTITDTILTRQVNVSGTVYSARERQTLVVGYGTQGGATYPTNVYTTTLSYPNSLFGWMDTTKMPEEWYNPFFYYYYEGDTSFCLAGNQYKKADNYISRTGAQVNTFEPCGYDSTVKEGIGLISTYRCLDASASGIETGRTLRYIKRSSGPCGAYSDLAVSTLSAAPAFQVFPNPATESLTIGGISNTFAIAVFSIDGRKLSDASALHAPYTLSTVSLPAGSYWLQCTADGWRRIEKIIVVH